MLIVTLVRAASALAVLVSSALVPAADVRAVDYRPPVDAPVVEAFDVSDGPFGPGNRGLDYATAAGTAVRAIGPGRVTFAGQVAGQLHVTVLHPDGLRSTYSFLATVDVEQGRRVGRGERVGTSDRRLHLGVRRADVYIDPAMLFGPRRARLVPL